MNRFKAFLVATISVLVPYCLFAFSLYFLFYVHSSIFTPYEAHGGIIALAVFSMILLSLGSNAISPLDLTINIIADIQTPSGAYEVVEHGPNNYSVGKRGDAGIGIIILKFIVNVILSPFMVIYYLVLVMLIIFKSGFADSYLHRIEKKRGIIASAFMLIGFTLSTIEYVCFKNDDKTYSPEKMTITLSDIHLENESYYKDHFVRKEYHYSISFYHPVSNVNSAEFQECIVKYNGKTIDRHTMYTYILRRGYDRNTFSLIGSFVNTYIDENYDGYDYNKIDQDYYDFHDYINFSEIDLSKFEIHFMLRYANVGGHVYSYIRTGWKDINSNIKFASN